MFTVRRLSSPLHPLSLYSNSPDVYQVCAEGIQPRNMKNRDTYWRRHKVQESLDNNKDKASQSPASRHLGPSHSSPNFRHLPCHIFLNLFEGLKPLPFQKISVLGKSISRRAPHQGWRGQRFSQTTLHDALHVARGATLSWCSCQSPVAYSCSLQSRPNSLHRNVQLNVKSDADSLLYWLSHFECDGHRHTRSLRGI